MGEAKRRRALDPNHGKNRVQRLIQQLIPEFKAGFAEHGRGFIASLSGKRLCYLSRIEVEKLLQDADNGSEVRTKLLEEIDKYDPDKIGLFVYFNAADIHIARVDLTT